MYVWGAEYVDAKMVEGWVVFYTVFISSCEMNLYLWPPLDA